MSGGWGKRAASRIDRTQFEQDELLKSLGTQFNVDLSGYDQWQRKPKVGRPKHVSSKDDNSFVVGRVSSATTDCQHGTFRERKQAAKQKELNKERSERIQVLELRLRTRRKTLADYQKRLKELLDQNIQLKASIDEREGRSNDAVKALLRKYEKYRGGMTNLSSQFATEREEALQDLQHTKMRLSDSMSRLQERVDTADQLLKDQENQLQILNSYKDKEYPVKAMNISTLQKDIQTLKASNQEEQMELERIINTEIGKYQSRRIQESNQVTHSVTEKAVAMMHPSLKDMALQNLVMKKEIEFHGKEEEELKKDITCLEREITRMLRDPRTNTRFQLFPEFYPTAEKCSPDMDVVLDIPTQTWLPL